MPDSDVSPLRIRCDARALQANFRWFAAKAGVPAAAAVKADAYGTGVAGAVPALLAAGCTRFLVSSWAEALAVPPLAAGLLVLHGFTADCAGAALALPQARPVLNTMAQVAQWAQVFPARTADLMVDTGMNRLGIAPADVAAALALVPVHTLHSHLACADQPGHPLNAVQLACFGDLVAATPHLAHNLANSAAVCLGRDWSFSGVRPGIGLYGGHPHEDAPGARVATPEARVIQQRMVPAGQAVGYGAESMAAHDRRVAIVNIGYADGVPRGLGRHLFALAGDRRFPAVGRISMDMLAIDVTGGDVAEGDWLALDWDLAALSALSGFSEYELLTGLSRRAPRRWQ